MTSKRSSGGHDWRRKLRDPSPLVRREAAQALGASGRATEVRELLQVLTEDGSAAVRKAAADALGRIGHHSARPVLERSSRHDDDETVRQAAAAALARLTAASGETPAVLPKHKE
ncbi:MAG TPA: HEAT repeat domain-containing protein [Gemmatimonadales bacterium]|nr:HEAT repeat domain-containing protein [Gemmatimonadales bacterium]